MPHSHMDISRRNLLTAAAVGAASAATVALIPPTAPRANAAGRRGAVNGFGVTAPPPSTLTELEAKALALQPPVFLFETTVPTQLRTSHGASLSIDAAVHHSGGASLKWDYVPGSALEVNVPLRLVPPSGGNGADIGADVNTLAFWIYQSTPSTGTLRIEAGRDSLTDAWCEMNLDFTGWRTAWIRYQDMRGNPRADMDALRFVAPANTGTLHLDSLIVNTQLRSNFPTPDRQAPFINPEVHSGANEHWLDLLWFSEQDAKPLELPTPSTNQSADLAVVEAAYTATVGQSLKVTAASVAAIASAVDALGVPAAGASSGSGSGSGMSILGHQDAIWPAAIADDVARLSPETLLQTYTKEMLTIAAAYNSTEDPSLQVTLGDLYVRMIQHLWDQGWTDGSCQGTIHHLGYQAGAFYPSVWLMRNLLDARGLLKHATASLAWLVGMGRTRQDARDANLFYNGIFDILNTTLIGMVGSALLSDSVAEKVARLRLVQQWLDNAIALSPGTQGGFKPDFTTFHHMGHYPAYARDGFSGGSPALAVLAGTGFAISTESHERWNQSLLAMRFYANQTNWPLSLSNRHPTGVDSLKIAPYQTMTKAGSPDGKHPLDPAMGAAFLRLLPAKPSSAQKALAAQLAAAGITAEPDPTGCQVMNHAALVSHRRDNWLVSVRGHNRYLWSTEIYPGNNEYGRYVTYGQVQVLSGGDPATNAGSGYVQPGWDWNRWPGTTAIQLPFPELVADISPTGEELLLTDQRIGGGGTIGGQNGAFMMSLHENAKYDGSFYARKSVFLFDNRVVALGSGIVNNDRGHHTETTLFQCQLTDETVPTQDSRAGAITSVPYSNSGKLSAAVWLIDPQNVGYYVPRGQQLVLTRAAQTAPDQGATTQASLPYATAVLDHGTKPRHGSYEYAMIIGASAGSMSSFASDMSDRRKAAYTVLRRDDGAHVVHDHATQITAHAVFEPSRNLTRGIVTAVDTPSIVLAQPDGDNLTISVTDPDLRFYAGPDRSDPIASPFGVPWRDAPSQGSRITLELAGTWMSQASGVSVRPGRRTTTVTVQCADGLPTELTLTRV